MHLTEQSNVVKSTTAAYSQKYPLIGSNQQLHKQVYAVVLL